MAERIRIERLLTDVQKNNAAISGEFISNSVLFCIVMDTVLDVVCRGVFAYSTNYFTQFVAIVF